MADSDDPKVIDFEPRRKKKALEDDIFKGRNPVEHLLDLRGKKVHYAVIVAGKKKNVRLALLLSNVTRGPARSMGSLIFEQKQWEEFKEAGDRMLKAHLGLLKETNS